MPGCGANTANLGCAGKVSTVASWAKAAPARLATTKSAAIRLSQVSRCFMCRNLLRSRKRESFKASAVAMFQLLRKACRFPAFGGSRGQQDRTILNTKSLSVNCADFCIPQRHRCFLLPLFPACRHHKGGCTSPNALVVDIFDRFSQVHRSALELQCVVRPCIGRKPMPIHVLSVGNKPRMQVRKLMFFHLNLFRPSLSTQFHDLKILRVHPDSTLKIALPLLFFFRFDVELIRIQVVHMLLS